MQYILNEYEYEKLQRASSKQNDLLQEKVWDLKEELEAKDYEITRLTAQLTKYRNKYGLLEKTSWSRTSSKFNF